MHGGELQDFHFAASAGCDDHGDVANFLIQQGAPDRRGSGDLAGGHIGLFASHQLVFHFFILGAVENRHGRAETNFILGDIVHVDQRQVGQALAQLADARLQILLALLGHVILGVLAEVAHGDGLLELFGDIVGEFPLQPVQFVPKLLLDIVRHRSGHYNLGHGNWHSASNFRPHVPAPPTRVQTTQPK